MRFCLPRPLLLSSVLLGSAGLAEAAEAEVSSGAGGNGTVSTKAAEGQEFRREEIEAWLESNSVDADVRDSTAPEFAPPPAPQHRGVVLEAALGAFGHVGDMKHISPVAPWFHFQLGYEFLDWLMLFAEGDLMFGSTRFARPPPQPRGYTLYGGGAGLRLTYRPTDWLGIYTQGSVGAGRVDSDVLSVYGFQEAEDLNPYFSGTLGFEWYQVSPHMALALHGGVRNYPSSFDQERSSTTPLAWTAASALRYAF